MDHSPDGASLMAICAVSGSVALLAFQAYKRLLSDFMKRMEHELGRTGKTDSPGSQLPSTLVFFFYIPISSSLPVTRLHAGSVKSRRRRPRVRFTDESSLCEPTELGVPKKARGGGQSEQPPLSSMPFNRKVLYRGIMRYRNIRRHHMSDSF
ncbi:hypothetical protein SAY86_018720 [Trapa natans]|uniref:Uncharacterized protein n=1 Tax=Trapa natans TaxID=22666 RepID=A0AAN7QZ36_TRANT|nr:hypothetical protein SAY86_018720 [Trapa natans]